MHEGMRDAQGHGYIVHSTQERRARAGRTQPAALFDVDGKLMTKAQIAEMTGISVGVIARLLKEFRATGKRTYSVGDFREYFGKRVSA